MSENWKNTIFSDESENFISNPCPKLNEIIQIKLRVKIGAPISKVFLICWPTGEVIMNKMEKISTNDGFDYYGVDMKMTHIIFDYRFLILYEDSFLVYTPKGCIDIEPADFYSFRIVADSDYSSWPIDGVFYQIFPDRFARGRETQLDDRKFEFHLPDKVIKLDRILSEWDEPVMLDSWERRVMQFYGGNFSGIISKMSYLADLGITALYLCPIFKARSNHRYDIEDYLEPDPLLGTEQELSDMIETAHKYGIKIIFDGVLNHTGLFHKWFDHLKETQNGAFDNENSPYRDFYIFNEDGTFDSWFDCKILPQLNHNNPELMEQLLESPDSAIKKWLQLPFNIDGWRMDTAQILGRYHAKFTDDEFNKKIHSAIKSVNPDAYVMGESFYDPMHLIANDKYEATMNYRGFMMPIKMWLTGQMTFLTNPRGHEYNEIKYSGQQVLTQMNAIRASMPYQNQIRMYNLLNSHDTPRFITLLKGDIKKLQIAVAILFTYIGVPALYYGDEIGLEGDRDPDCRRPMIWDENKQNKNVDIIYRNLIKLRKRSKVLQRGSFMSLYAANEIISFARMLGNEYSITICNNSNKCFDVDIPTEQLCDNGTMFTQFDFVDNCCKNTYLVKDGCLSITLQPYDSIILLKQQTIL